MSESLAMMEELGPKRKEDCSKPPADRYADPEPDRDYFLELKYPSFATLARAIFPHAQRRGFVTRTRRRAGGLGVYLDFADPSSAWDKMSWSSGYGQSVRYVRKDTVNVYEAPCGLSSRAFNHHGRHMVDL